MNQQPEEGKASVKNIRDYIHFYLWCECAVSGISQSDNETFKLTGISYDDTQKIWWAYFENTEFGYAQVEDVWMHLRQLSDMTEEEANVMWQLLGWNERIKGNQRAIDIIREFDVIYEDNDATNNAHWGYFIKILPYMLKQSFDIFGLIDAGIALDKTKLNNTQTKKK